MMFLVVPCLFPPHLYPIYTLSIFNVYLKGREDQAEEMELNLIRDPYLLGDASWVPESVDETAEWRRLEVRGLIGI